MLKQFWAIVLCLLVALFLVSGVRATPEEAVDVFLCADESLTESARLNAFVIGTTDEHIASLLRTSEGLTTRLYGSTVALQGAIEEHQVLVWTCSAAEAQEYPGRIYSLTLDSSLIPEVAVGYVSGNGTLTLRPEELELISGLGALRIGLPMDSEPVIFREQDGQPYGLDADIVSILAKRLGAEFVWEDCGSWSACVDALQAGDIDGLTFFTPTPQRMEFSVFTIPYWDVPWALAGGEQLPRVRQFADLEGLRVAVVESYSVVEELQENPRIELILVERPEHAFRAILEGDADVYMDSLPLLLGRVREQHLSHLRLSVLYDERGDHVSVGLRRDLDALVPLLDRAILSITAEDRRTISQRWFDPRYEQGLARETVRKWAALTVFAVLILTAIMVLWLQHLRREIARRRVREKEARFRALHDELTELPNRANIQEQIELALLSHSTAGTKFALMFVDLDGFKAVNDERGHEAGDELLFAVAQRLKRATRKTDLVARFGGDEFVILVRDVESPEQAQRIGEKFLTRVAQPYTISTSEGSFTAKIGASIGVALFPDHGVTQDDLLRAADDAMYEVKEAGKHGVFLARPEQPRTAE